MKKITYRGVKGTQFIWHGEWSDPEVRYKDEGFSYYAVEDEFRVCFQDHIYSMPEWFKDNGIECADTDDSFDKWFAKQDHEWVTGILDDLISCRREYCRERFAEQYDVAMRYIECGDEFRWWYDAIGRMRFTNNMSPYESEAVWNMAYDDYEQKQKEAI